MVILSSTRNDPALTKFYHFPSPVFLKHFLLKRFVLAWKPSLFFCQLPRYPLISYHTNPLASSVLELKLERRLRTAWTLVPNVGFVLAAMVPSLSDCLAGWGQ